MEGKLSISRMSSNRPEEQDIIRIRLEDELSSIEFVEIRMTPEAFALALTGLAAQECSFRLNGIHLVGKRRELKDEIIPEPEGGLWGWNEGAKRQYLAKYETDGWKVHNLSDFGNHHCKAGNSYRVGFIRFVDADEKGGPNDNP